MKYLRSNEEFNEKINFKFIEKLKVKKLCYTYNIKNYSINDDMSIDVDDHVNLSSCGLTKIPIKFKKVNSFFECMDNNLTSLVGCPESIYAYFECDNNELTSLEGCPKYIGSFFSCLYNKMRTFEGFPINLVGIFYCRFNPIYEFWKLFEDKDKVELFNDFGITDGEVVILDRLNEFLEMIGKPILTDTSGLEKEGYKII